MTWKINPGPIAHIDHVWQPQSDDWMGATRLALQGFTDIAMLAAGNKATVTHVTQKFDDAMSAKICKYDGMVWVAYKGANSLLMCQEDMVRSSYKDKPEIAEKLVGLLRYGPQLFGEVNNVMYQVGIIAYDESGLPKRVTPNIINYELVDVKPEHRLALTIVSKSNLTPTGDPVTIDTWPSLPDNTQNVYIMDSQSANIDKLVMGPSLIAELFRDILDAHDAAYAMNDMWHDISISDAMQQYLHQENREPSFNPRVAGYLSFLNLKFAKELACLKAEKWRLSKQKESRLTIDRIVQQRHSYETAFELCRRLHQCAVTICDMLEYSVEGFVISQSSYQGHVEILKIVDPVFTRDNHMKWKAVD